MIKKSLLSFICFASCIFAMEQGGKNYYLILGIKPSATLEEVKKGFKDAAKHWHPDKNQGNKEAEEKFKEVAEAYGVLGNEDLRKKYDALFPVDAPLVPVRRRMNGSVSTAERITAATGAFLAKRKPTKEDALKMFDNCFESLEQKQEFLRATMGVLHEIAVKTKKVLDEGREILGEVSPPKALKPLVRIADQSMALGQQLCDGFIGEPSSEVPAITGAVETKQNASGDADGTGARQTSGKPAAVRTPALSERRQESETEVPATSGGQGQGPRQIELRAPNVAPAPARTEKPRRINPAQLLSSLRLNDGDDDLAPIVSQNGHTDEVNNPRVPTAPLVPQVVIPPIAAQAKSGQQIPAVAPESVAPGGARPQEQAQSARTAAPATVSKPNRLKYLLIAAVTALFGYQSYLWYKENDQKDKTEGEKKKSEKNKPAVALKSDK